MGSSDAEDDDRYEAETDDTMTATVVTGFTEPKDTDVDLDGADMLSPKSSAHSDSASNEPPCGIVELVDEDESADVDHSTELPVAPKTPTRSPATTPSHRRRVSGVSG